MAAKYEGDEFRERFGPWAVVAGGSDGIGAAYGRELARRGLNVALVARRAEPLEQMAAAIRAEFDVQTLAISADLTSPDPVSPIAAQTDALDVGLLVYNAGASRVSTKFVDTALEDLTFLVQLSCRGPLLLAHHFGKRLQARGRGGLILMSSMSCLSGCSYQAVYSATKAFDTILAEGLWHEFAPRGVDVLGVIAGATRTESVLHTSDKFADAMDPAEVATGALDHLGKGPNWVPGEANRAAARGMWPIPRVAAVNGMSQACASLFDLPHTPVEGLEHHEG
jgi:short-subunit dehydrogenase